MTEDKGKDMKNIYEQILGRQTQIFSYSKGSRYRLTAEGRWIDDSQRTQKKNKTNDMIALEQSVPMY